MRIPVSILVSMMILPACNALFPDSDGKDKETGDSLTDTDTDTDTETDADTDVDADTDTDTEPQEEYVYPEDFDLYDGPVEGRLAGVVTDGNGEGVSSITVTLSTGEITETDGNGAFMFTDIPPVSGLIVKAGSMNTTTSYARVDLTSWETQTLRLSVTPVDQVVRMDATIGGEISEGTGTIVVPPNAFRDSLGNIVTGEVDVAVTVSDHASWAGPSLDPDGGMVRTTDPLADAPGDFRGIDSSGTETPLASFGYFEMHVSRGGEYMSIDDEAPMTVSFEYDESDIPEDQADLIDPDNPTMPMWGWDPDTAMWQWMRDVDVMVDPDGTTTVTAPLTNADPAEPGSLDTVWNESWGPTYAWNCDWAYSSSCAEVTVLDPLGNPIVGANVSMDGLGYYVTHYVGTESGTTNGDGKVVVWGRAYSVAEINASVQVDNVTYTETVHPYYLNAGLDSYGSSSCPYQVTVVIPVCIKGADINLMVNNFWQEYPDGSILSFTTPWGNAVYYEPDGEFERCEPEWMDMEIGTCVFQDGEVDLTDNDLPDTNGAGEITRIKQDGVVAVDFLPYVDPDGRSTYQFQDSDSTLIGSQMTDGTYYDLKVQGEEDGVPGFEVEDAVWMPVTPAFTSSEEFSFSRGSDLRLPIEASGDEEVGIFVSARNVDEDGVPTGSGMVFCRVEDRTSVTVPASGLSYLESGRVAFGVYRPGLEWVQMPTGYVAMATSWNVTQGVGVAE